MILRLSALVLAAVVIPVVDGHAQITTAKVASFKAGEVASALDTAFRAGQKKPIESFLEDWHRDSKPVSDDVFRKKPDFERSVYAIYMSFYSPPKWARKGRYKIVQESVDVALIDGDLSDFFAQKARRGAAKIRMTSRITIHDFRPAMSAGSENVLYMEPKRVDVLLRFLTGTDKDLLDTYQTEPNGADLERGSPGDKIRESRRSRLSYLDDSMDILPNMSGKGWRLLGSMSVLEISLSVGLESAIVTYYDGYSVDSALVQKDIAGWRVIRRKTGVIE